MFEVMEALNKRMAQFEKELQTTPPTSITDSLAADYNTFKAFTVQVLRAFQQQLLGLVRDVDQQEMRSRRKILLIHGASEEKNEDCAVLAVKLISSRLCVSDFNVGLISRCQRMGRPVQGRARPLLIKFRELGLRDKVWYSKTNLKGTGITLSEFLTKPRHDTFMAARQRFGVTKCWTRDGYIHILKPDGTRHRISNLSELHNIEPATAVTSKPEVASTGAAKDTVPPRARRAVTIKK